MGAPPHGGIAPGIDRMLMVLAREPNLRDVDRLPEEPGRRRPDERRAERRPAGAAGRARTPARTTEEGDLRPGGAAADATGILSAAHAVEEEGMTVEGPGAAREQAPAMTSLPTVESLPPVEGGYEAQAVRDAFEAYPPPHGPAPGSATSPPGRRPHRAGGPDRPCRADGRSPSDS